MSHASKRLVRLAPLLAAAWSTLATPALSVSAAAPPSARVWSGPITESAVPIGAGAGHVVAVLPTAAGGELVELVAGAAPRHIRNLQTHVATPTVGLDAAGRPVAVLSPCLEVDARERPKTPRCSLEVVHLDDGSSTSLPRSAGAYLGAIDRGAAVVARRSQVDGVRVAFLPSDGRATKPISLASVREAADAPKFISSARVATGLSLRRGVVAVVVHADFGGGHSLLLRSDRGRPWQHLAHSGYGEASGIPRVFRAPVVTKAGVRAYYDGGDNDAGWVGRWNARGNLVKRVPTKPYGAPTINLAATWDGDRLLVEIRDYDSDSGEPGTFITAHGPFPLG